MEVEVIKGNKPATGFVNKKTEKLRVAAYCRVSKDTEDQLNSYRSQVLYYTETIQKNPDWIMTEVYADEAITGTLVTKRESFQKMLNDCLAGKIDMIITKSISRFARNTLDTLKYVRLLKEHQIAVFFEDENINTLTMDGELLLVVLSSVAQQEVENISDNVKKGLKMKMQRGELVGFQGCYGYDYDPETKSISVNREEAEYVRYIFDRYLEGAGSTLIAHELNEKGILTRKGMGWVHTSVMGILRNEKYKGDLRMGKTYTEDPIAKTRRINYGEEDQFYIKNHHEAIVSAEIFDKAQEIRQVRGSTNKWTDEQRQQRKKLGRQYTFSSYLECGFCGGNVTRKSWHSSSKYNKYVWGCGKSVRDGRRFCPQSKSIPETDIEAAFVQSYRLLCSDNKEVLDEFIRRIEESLKEETVSKVIEKLDKDIEALEKKKKKLLDMVLDEKIQPGDYEQKSQEIADKLEKLLNERAVNSKKRSEEKSLKTRTMEFKKFLEKNQVMETFDKTVFESVIEKVIVGGKDNDGNDDPYKLTFVYKTGISNQVNAPKKRTKITESMKDNLSKLSSSCTDEVKKMFPPCTTDECGSPVLESRVC